MSIDFYPVRYDADQDIFRIPESARADLEAYSLNVSFAPPAGDSNVEQVGFAASVESTYAAPEIDPASAVAGLTLLVGGLLVFRGRRTSTNLTFA